jgi:hypothetical protein
MELNVKELKAALMEISVYITNTNYETLLNMPTNERDLLVKAYNKKVTKENKQ